MTPAEALLAALIAKREGAWTDFRRRYVAPKMPEKYREDLQRAFEFGWTEGALASNEFAANLVEEEGNR
jgi:hypothetical protein